LLKAHWERNLGIEVELINQEAKVYQDNLAQLKYEGVGFLNFSADYMDPNTYLSLFTSDQPYNGGWKSTKYDELVTKADADLDSATHLQLLAEAEDYLMQNQPIIPIYVGVWSFVKKPYVVGVQNNLFDKHPLKFTWIDTQWQNHGATAH
jgi:oligopeptide transport system substrate-binding protein